MKNTTGEQLAGGLGILVVSPRANVANEGDFSYFFPVPLDIDNGPLWNFGLNYPCWETGYKAMSLSCHLLILLAEWYMVPCRQIIALGDGTVCLRQTVNMNRMKVQVGHLLKQMSGRRTSGHGNLDRIRKLLSLLSIAEHRVDSRSSIEMGDMLLLKQFPDRWVIDLSQAVVGSTD